MVLTYPYPWVSQSHSARTLEFLGLLWPNPTPRKELILRVRVRRFTSKYECSQDVSPDKRQPSYGFYSGFLTRDDWWAHQKHSAKWEKQRQLWTLRISGLEWGEWWLGSEGGVLCLAPTFLSSLQVDVFSLSLVQSSDRKTVTWTHLCSQRFYRWQHPSCHSCSLQNPSLRQFYSGWGRGPTSCFLIGLSPRGCHSHWLIVFGWMHGRVMATEGGTERCPFWKDSLPLKEVRPEVVTFFLRVLLPLRRNIWTKRYRGKMAAWRGNCNPEDSKNMGKQKPWATGSLT